MAGLILHLSLVLGALALPGQQKGAEFPPLLEGPSLQELQDQAKTRSRPVTPSAEVVPGTYHCLIKAYAEIRQVHVEPMGDAAATSSSEPQHFLSLVAEKTADGVTIRETGAEPVGLWREWHTDKSTLHSDYAGDGYRFLAISGNGWVSMWRAASGRYQFWHSGVAWAGGADPAIVSHWGECLLNEKWKSHE